MSPFLAVRPRGRTISKEMDEMIQRAMASVKFKVVRFGEMETGVAGLEIEKMWIDEVGDSK